MADPRLAAVRGHLLALPEVTERLSHGRPAWFVGRQFAAYMDDHHGDGRVALWCAAPAGQQEGLVAAAPEQWFRPPYVGHRGWIGVRLDRGLEWDAIAGALEEAYCEVAPPRLVEALRRA